MGIFERVTRGGRGDPIEAADASKLGVGDMNDPAPILEQVVAAARVAENAAAQTLAAVREGTEANRELVSALAAVVGWSPGFYDVIAAEGKVVTGAEAAFAAAVEQREAAERLRDELRR